MRPIFCGNIEFDARQGDLERLFRKYGKVDRVDLKSGIPLDDHPTFHSDSGPLPPHIHHRHCCFSFHVAFGQSIPFHPMTSH
ncbi:putative RNA recognition motif domain, nucleotide-binding alpha-beta plait domain superfamily [Helianthus debilis subsp. tardiflorus]